MYPGSQLVIFTQECVVFKNLLESEHYKQEVWSALKPHYPATQLRSQN